MKLLLRIHRDFSTWQKKQSSKLILSGALVALVLAVMLPIFIRSVSLNESKFEVYGVLTGPDQHVAALELEETGFINISGEMYGDDRLKGLQILDENLNVVDPASATALLLSNRIPTWMPAWLLQAPMMSVATTFLILFWFLITVWMGLFQTMLYASIIATVSYFVCNALGAPNAAKAILGMCLLGYSYQLCIRLLQFIFSSPRQISSIARGVLLEATRTKLSLTFIAMLLLILPLIPLLIDPESPLRHQIQTMLSRSLGVSFTIAAFLTVFLGCATVAFEIRDKQIWQVLTKPVSRVGYLLGKWVGILSLNLVILIIAGTSVFMYLQYLRTSSVAPGLQGDLDRLAVNEEILTARVEAEPRYEYLTNEQIASRVEDLIDADPELRNEESIRVQLRQKMREDIEEQFLTRQRAIPAVRGGVFSRTYNFENLQHAKEMGTPLAFKYKFHIGVSDEHEVYQAGLVYNEDVGTRHTITYVPTMTHVTMIPAEFINDDGTLKISIYNLYEPPPTYVGHGTLSFDKGGIKLLYRVSNFEGNFFRAMLVLWIKLAFLAALALSASTFLSFPVACMVTLTIFASGTLAPFLAESLNAYVPPPTSAIDFGNIAQVVQWAFENAISAIAKLMVFLFNGFGAQRPTDQLVNGMLVSWKSVLHGFLTIGIVWSGIVLSIGSIVLRKRQLAIYSGSG